MISIKSISRSATTVDPPVPWTQTHRLVEHRPQPFICEPSLTLKTGCWYAWRSSNPRHHHLTILYMTSCHQLTYCESGSTGRIKVNFLCKNHPVGPRLALQSTDPNPSHVSPYWLPQLGYWCDWRSSNPRHHPLTTFPQDKLSPIDLQANWWKLVMWEDC